MSQSKPLFGRESLAEQCADIIYQNIINMKPGYEPGSRLSGRSLAQEFGISETPLKLAFKLLENQGVLSVLPRKGTFVSELSEKDVQELLTVRSGMEGLAVTLAEGIFTQEDLLQLEESLAQCELALTTDETERYRDNDEKFHRLIVNIAHNQRLNRLYADLITSEQIIQVYTPRSEEAKRQSTQGHRVLLEQFHTSDVTIILDALQKHWKNSARRVLEGYKKYIHNNTNS